MKKGSPATVLEPIRAEIFGVDRLEQHARSLARDHEVDERPRRGYRLLRRLESNARVLRNAYDDLTEAVQKDQSISPAAEWLIDNFHVVDEQIREIRESLPSDFYRELPKLKSGELRDYPRVYGLMSEFVAHTDSHFDSDVLERFVDEYEEVTPLTIGELWALPATYRIVLVENLRRIAERLVVARRVRSNANELADLLLSTRDRSPEEIQRVLRPWKQDALELPFAVTLVQRLRESDPAIMPALEWLDERLAEGGVTAEDVVRREHARQLAAHATVGNVITGMRQISAFDWSGFVERVSRVERTLRSDPCGLYKRMDFATRDFYRHVVEQLARGTKLSELQVAERVVERSREVYRAVASGEDVEDGRGQYLGYHLGRMGRREFERELGYRPELSRRLRGVVVRGAERGYLGTIATVTGLILALIVAYTVTLGTGWSIAALIALLAVAPASDLVIAVVNRDVTEFIRPRRLPKLDFSEGIPPEYSTLVVVPTLLTGPEDIGEQTDQLEHHFLANPDDRLTFALLSDWKDAPRESMPDDEMLLVAAVAAISELNERYGPRPDGGARFLLFHRQRKWNEREGRWMGWERKRGKIHEINWVLQGNGDTTFLKRHDGLTDPPEGIRYVITLDADTRLPPGAAHRLVGALAHPLNRARFDPRRRRVVSGYGVLQPRVTPVLPPGGERSLFHRIYAGPTGIDPYSAAVSDVYQDLFGEGSYIGKGIYDVQTFESALEGRVPENALLSHDLFEGSFARTGLVSDIEVFDDFPSHYESSARRVHRWARGDWQLLPWIVGSGPGRGGDHRPPNDLRFINRWKMVDNLRRTLSPPSTFLILLAGWALLPISPLLWTGFVVAALAMPEAVPVVTGLLPRRRGIAKRAHIRGVVGDATEALARIGLAIVFLPNRAGVMADAIVRTVIRLYLTRKRMLEWVPAAMAGRQAPRSVVASYRAMWRSVVFTVASATLLMVVRIEAALLALPILLMWATAPIFAMWVSQPIGRLSTARVRQRDVGTLRLVARRNWQYFERFVTEEEGWLPPDNFQEDPEPVVARRTSPTNIGMYLLSLVAARDFGWIGSLDLLERVERTLDTVERLERVDGHFYNWYSTETGDPLEPRYVSTVDSGNLAGHLLVVAEACRERADVAQSGDEVWSGIGDAVELARDSKSAVGEVRSVTVSRHDLAAAFRELETGLSPIPMGVAERVRRLDALAAATGTLVDVTTVFAEERDGGAFEELEIWSRAALETVASHIRDLDALAAWAHLVVGGPPEAIAGEPELEDMWEAIGASLEDLWSTKDGGEALEEVSSTASRLGEALERRGRPQNDEAIDRLAELKKALVASSEAGRDLARRLREVAARADRVALSMDFSFLYDQKRKLFPIGYRVAEARFDTGYYDLLASEARLASFVAIAKGDVTVDHWFHLGRSITPVGRGSALLSWSGSMFEYLMPYLVMEAAPATLLEATQRRIVRRQIRYGEERGVPWGVSESAYNARDLHLTYQYSHFGIPGLGLTRGLSEDLVVAPYATALAAMVEPAEAIRNFRRLAEAGARGRYGYYEAVDYTPSRIPKDHDLAVVRAYMAHHQGMSIVALGNVVHDGVMRERFHAVPILGATELLLQERVPRDVAVARPRAEEVKAGRHVREIVPPVVRRFDSPHLQTPETHFLSNGRYQVMLTNGGSGYSRWNKMAVTRWQGDPTRDARGTFVFVRDTGSGQAWSAGYQPMAAEPENYEVAFSEDRAEIRRRDEAIETLLEVIVSPEDDGELRRVTLRNLGGRTREIEITTYAEVTLSPPESDAAHPAFQNLFVETEALPTHGGILATRRPRSSDELRLWAVHVEAVEGEKLGSLQFETDRARFIDRGRGIRAPSCVVEGRPLSNSSGAVLDPIFSLRRTVRLRAGETARVTFSTLVAESREEALNLADKYHDPAIFERESALAWTQAQVQLQHLGIAPDEAHLFQRLAGRTLYLDARLRPSSSVIARTDRGQQDLWKHGISGDLPIVLVRIDQLRDREIVRQILRAHEYWRLKGLAVDLIVLNEHGVSYGDELQDWLDRQVRVSQSRARQESETGQGEVFVLRTDQISDGDRDLLRTAARIVLQGHQGSLAEQLEALWKEPEEVARAAPVPAAPVVSEAPPPRPRLAFFNGLGGFSEGGREYVTILGEGQWTPAPWINVIANPQFGFQVSESGSGFTWAINSQANRLTPWSNDPVSDPPGEVMYVRDEEEGTVWTPTPLPIREPQAYVIRHGQGWSRFEHQSHEVVLDLLQFVPREDPVKISRLTIRNLSSRPRRLSVTAYAEWVLGTFRDRTAPFTVTGIDEQTGALLARNRYNDEFAGRVAFADMVGQQTSWTGDRTEFIGRNGTLRCPAAMVPGKELGGSLGGGLDPCAALRRPVEIPPGGQVDVVFLLGQGRDLDETRALVERYRSVDVAEALGDVQRWWEGILGAVQVRTPDYSMAIILNHWLQYQALSCRVWARSAFYQSGGAIGFRDQLQDVMALAVSGSDITREHLLAAAAHQFPEGDVLHWWHPPTGRGVRTRISDDRVWLPFALTHYLRVSGDESILDEDVPFVEGPALEPGEVERYMMPVRTGSGASLYEHCARAIDISLQVGRHGLPLMGSGDWNDGMNRVGHQGRGESVWLGWFLYLTIRRMIPVAESREDGKRVERWRGFLADVGRALEEHGWDGHWYRRAFFDDGTVLGSAASDECQIDSIAQSWGVLSGAAPPERGIEAMKAVEQYLVRRGDGLVLLFTPPFDRTPYDPGYIKGYLPGVRENGGQYTHAAIWVLVAFAELGDGDKATELFTILNPINHASTRAGIHRYKVEPYAAVADVYAEPPHLGRGGWTWYTGSASWMYRAGIEFILGFRLRGSSLVLDPCIPRDWPDYEITFRFHDSVYEVRVENPHGVMKGVQRVEVDGVVVPHRGWEPGEAEDRSDRKRGTAAQIPLANDGESHTIRAVLG